MRTVLGTRQDAVGKVLDSLSPQRRYVAQVASARLPLLGVLGEEHTEVAVRAGEPRIHRDRRAVRRLRAVEVLRTTVSSTKPRLKCALAYPRFATIAAR